MNHATESPTARKGVFAATITPVKADLTVDVVALADYCTSVMERGCDGVAPLGSAGEANSIAMGTRLRVPAALKSAGLAGISHHGDDLVQPERMRR